MAMVWNNMESFRKHVEQMRMFCQSHPVLETVASRRPRLDVLEITRPLHVADITRGMGGLRDCLNAEEWHALVPIRRVTLPGGSQN